MGDEEDGEQVMMVGRETEFVWTLIQLHLYGRRT